MKKGFVISILAIAAVLLILMFVFNGSNGDIYIKSYVGFIYSKDATYSFTWFTGTLYLLNLIALIIFSTRTVVIFDGKNFECNFIVTILSLTTIILYYAKGSIADISDIIALIKYHNIIIVLVFLLQFALVVVAITQLLFYIVFSQGRKITSLNKRIINYEIALEEIENKLDIINDKKDEKNSHLN